MKPDARFRWLEDRIAESENGAVYVLDSEFVDAYALATKAKVDVAPWGANKCVQLGRDLSTMHSMGTLSRYRIGLSGGAWQPGFPKWVYIYSLSKIHKD